MFVRRVAGVVVVSALVLAACNGDPEPEVTSTADPAIESIEATDATPTPTPTPTPSPTPTPVATSTPTAPPTVSSEWAVPDPITDDYVQRVLNELYRLEVPIRERILGQALAGDSWDDAGELAAMFHPIRTPQDAALSAAAIAQFGPDDLIARTVTPVAAVVVTGAEVIERATGCVVAVVQVDYRPAYNDVDTSTFNAMLERGEGNDTGWLIAAQQPEPPPSCEA